MSEQQWNLRTAASAATLLKPCKGPRWLAAPAMTAAVILAGCVSVKAPDQPIVIELNINIKQEVIYRLAEDASNTIENNPEIF